MAVNWQCFAISLAFHICYDIHAPSSATVLLSNFHIFLLSHFGIRGGIIFYKKELQFWEVIHIPTLNRLYDNDAATVLSEISMYPGILEEQLLRLHPEKEEQTINILRYLQRQGRIKRDRRNSYYSASNTLKSEREEVIRRIWVLLDFMPDVEYHAASDYPVAISFFIGGEEYQIIHATVGNESLLSAVITHHKNIIAKRLVLVDTPEQIPRLIFPGVVGYCTATIDGYIKYYKLK